MDSNNIVLLISLLMVGHGLAAYVYRPYRGYDEEVPQEGPQLNLWSLNDPIYYIFQEDIGEEQQTTFRDALSHIEANTCIRFREMGTDETIKVGSPHLRVTTSEAGCSSQRGLSQKQPQTINLAASCFEEFGAVVKEIVNTLGLPEAQLHPGQHKFIKVKEDNMQPDKMPMFQRNEQTDAVFKKANTQYDMASVTHSGPFTYSAQAGVPSVQTVDPLYQSTIGQRSGLSFFDAKALNNLYSCEAHNCNENGPLERACSHNGYRNPNDCTSCSCLTGFAGDYCDVLKASENAVCGGEMTVNEVMNVDAPGFPVTAYPLQAECNWLLTAPEGHVLKMKFIAKFGLYSTEQNICYHWVEIQYESLDRNGPRFCGTKMPETVLESEGRTVMITMRTNYTHNIDVFPRDGFQLKVWAESTIKTPPHNTGDGEEGGEEGNGEGEEGGGVEEGEEGTIVTKEAPVVTTITESPPTTTVEVPLTCSPKVLTVIEGEETIINSPGYPSSPYPADADCTWSITGPPDSWLHVKFVGDFGVFSGAIEKCVHYIEIGQSEEDPKAKRFCGSELPNVVISYESGSVFIRLTTNNYEGDASQDSRRGFQLKVWAEAKTTEAPTTTTAAPTTTTAAPTTTTAKKEFSFRCGFERDLCGMIQLKDDQFDWTRQKDVTPSFQTGPDNPHEGRYFIFIEATRRKDEDKARLQTPAVPFKGEYCLDFYYNMFGFHIKRLTVRIKGQNSSETGKVVWKKAGQRGQKWFNARVINLLMEEGDTIVFEGVVNGHFSGDIAIDDITFNLCKY